MLTKLLAISRAVEDENRAAGREFNFNSVQAHLTNTVKTQVQPTNLELDIILAGLINQPQLQYIG